MSLDKFADEHAATYESHAATVTLRAREEGICRLSRRTGPAARPEPMADVFMVDYRTLLMARYRDAGWGRKTLLAALGLGVMAGKGLWAMGGKLHVKRLRDRFQALYALACFSIVFVYLALVVVAAVGIVQAQFKDAKPDPTGSAPATNSAAAPTATNQGPLDFGTVWSPMLNFPQGPDAERWLAPPGAGAWDGRWKMEDGTAPPSAILFLPPEPPVGEWLEQVPGVVWGWVTWPFAWAWKLDPGLLLLVLTALGLAGGQGRENRVRAFINRASEEMLAFIYYLSFTDRRAEITGLVDARLEQIMESGAYSRFVVMGYSFGTVVALDAFCPASDARARRLDRVETLVTIASPYDFILTYWPRYFADRQHAPPPTWLNVYSPVDLLGTCFDKEKARAERAQRLSQPKSPLAKPAPDELQNSFGQADQLATGPTQEFAFREGIPDEQLGLFGWIAMQGLGAHSRYWAKGEDGERNCFDLLVPGMFPEEVAIHGTQRAR